jgi:hypothetical protein
MSIAAFKGQPGIDRGRALDIQEAQMQVNKKTQATARASSVMNEASAAIHDLLTSARDNGIDLNDEKVQESIRPLVELGLATGKTAGENTGVNYTAPFIAKLQTSMGMQSLAQIRQKEQDDSLAKAQGDLSAATATQSGNAALDQAKQMSEAQGSADAATATQTQRNANSFADAAQKEKEANKFGNFQQIRIADINGGNAKIGFLGPDDQIYHDSKGQVPAPTFQNMGPISTVIDATESGITGNIQLEKKGINDAQVGLSAADAVINTIARIEESYQKEFSTYSGRIRAWGTDTLEQFGVSTDPADKEFLRKFSTWQSNSIRLLNARIKFLSGAATSQQEAERIMQEMGNAKDGPTKYMSKMKATLQDIQDSRARLFYYSKKGIPVKYHPEGMTYTEAKNNKELYEIPVFGGRQIDLDDYRRSGKAELVDMTRSRYMELKASGMSPEQADATMENEGWP